MGLVDKWQKIDNAFVKEERRAWEVSEGGTTVVYQVDSSDVQALKREHLTGTYI